MADDKKILIDLEVKAGNLAKTTEEINKLRAKNKELSKSYSENSAEIEINKAKIKNLQQTQRTQQKEVQSLTKEVTKENGAYDKLNLTYQVAAKRAKDLSAAYGVNSTQAREANKEALALNNQLKSIDKSIGINRVGDYEDAIKNASASMGGLGGQLSRGVTGFKAMTTAAKSFIATPIGATIGAIVFVLGSLKAAFTSSEEGQNKWNKIVQVSSAILGNFTDILASIGEAIIYAFENPREALNDFVNFFKTNITNRVQGLIELFPKLGEAISLVFKGQWKEAGKVATDAVGKMALGVENITDRVNEATKAVENFTKEQIKEANQAAQVADMRAKAEKIDRELLVQRSKIEAEIAELRLKSREEDQYSATQRKAFLEEAIALQEGLLNKEVEVKELRFEAQKLENTFSRTNIENKQKEAQAEADLNNVQTQRLNFQRQIQREIIRTDGQIEAEKKESEARQTKELEEQLKAQIALIKSNTIDRTTALSEAYSKERLQLADEYAAGLISEKKYQDEKIKLQIAANNKEYEIKIAALEEQLQLDALDAEARIAIEQSIADSKKKFSDEATLRQIKNSEDLAKTEKDLAKDRKKVFSDLYASFINAGNSYFDRQISQLDDQIAKEEENSVIRQKLERDRAALVRQQAILNRVNSLFNIGISTAEGVMNYIKTPVTAPLVPFVVATGALQAAAVLSEPLPKAARGVYLRGNRHSQGGIPIEAEDGEVIVNRRSSSMFLPLLSAINQAGGGVPFVKPYADGGYVSRSTISNANVDFESAIESVMSRIKIYTTIEDIRREDANYSEVQSVASF